MLEAQPLDAIPLWGMYVLTVVLLYVGMELGYRSSLWRHRCWPDHAEAGAGAMLGASLGLLAFLMAFIVGLGANLTTERRVLALGTANANGTARWQVSGLSHDA